MNFIVFNSFTDQCRSEYADNMNKTLRNNVKYKRHRTKFGDYRMLYK